MGMAMGIHLHEGIDNFLDKICTQSDPSSLSIHEVRHKEPTPNHCMGT